MCIDTHRIKQWPSKVKDWIVSWKVEEVKNLVEIVAIILGGIWLVFSFSADKPLFGFLSSKHLETRVNVERSGLVKADPPAEALNVNLDVKNTGKSTLMVLRALVRVWGMKLEESGPGVDNFESLKKTDDGTSKNIGESVTLRHYTTKITELVATQQILRNYRFDPQESYNESITVYVPCGMYQDVFVRVNYFVYDGETKEWSGQWSLNSETVALPSIVRQDNGDHSEVIQLGKKESDYSPSQKAVLDELEDKFIEFESNDSVPLSDSASYKCPNH